MDTQTFNYDIAKTLIPVNAMSSAHLSELLPHCEVEYVFKGNEIFERGCYKREHVYVLHGEVELENTAGSVEKLSLQSSMNPLSHHFPRQYTARATSDCSIVRINSEELDRLLTWSQIADYLLLDISSQRDLDEDMHWMTTVLKSNLFHKVPPTNVQKIFSRLTPLLVSSEEVILRQGEIGDGCYFIKEGRAVVSQSPDGVKKPEPVASIQEGRCFGEDALVNDAVRNATVRMTSNGVLMHLRKRDFIDLLKEPEVATITREDFEKNSADYVCIDVRTDAEYGEGHLDSSANIPLNLLRLKTRQLNSKRTYLIYCDTGRRSRAAAWLLSEQGFKVFALDGGLDGKPNQKSRADNVLYFQDYVLRNGMAVAGQ